MRRVGCEPRGAAWARVPPRRSHARTRWRLSRACTYAHWHNAQGGTDPQWLLNPRKGDILAGFWGDAMEIDDGARLTWMCQPHYYLGLSLCTDSVGLWPPRRWPAGRPMKGHPPCSTGCKC